MSIKLKIKCATCYFNDEFEQIEDGLFKCPDCGNKVYASLESEID